MLTFFTILSANNEALTASTSQEVEVANFVKVSDVPQDAATVTISLKKIAEKIAEEKKSTKVIINQLKPYADSLVLVLKNSNYKNIAKQNARELQKMQSELAIYTKQLTEWDTILKNSIDFYDINKALLKEHSTLWTQTHINAMTENAPEAIIKHITSVIINIEELSNRVKEKYDKSLTSSQIITTKILTLKDIDSTLKKNEALVKNKIFYQNQAPFFEIISSSDFHAFEYIFSIKKIIIEKYYESVGYFQTNSELFLIFSIINFLILSFVIYFNYLYRKRKLFVSQDSYDKKDFFFIIRGFSTFFTLFILSIVVVFSNRPDAVIEMQLIIILVPVIRILQTVILKDFRKYIYSFFILYLLFLIDKNSIWADFELESRTLLIIINISLLIYFSSLIKHKVLQITKDNSITKSGNYLLYFYSILLVVALFANFYGLVSLSARIIDGVLATLYASIIFYTIYIILTGYVVVILRRRISTASNMLDIYANNIEKYTKTLIQLFMLIWWLVVVLKTLGLYPYIITLKNDFLSLSWDIAQTTISIQSIFDFIFIVVGTWILARLTRVVLEVEVFARFKFPRGLPTAITTTLNYIIVISGTILAFSSLGVTPQQFALVFGALGVGIGFGLRNIIANFVSGIIMVFERPIQIGDTIEVNGTMGSVQSIGARSSTLKTFDGSEVIIPNADFIAKEITNWTLSDERRRKTIEFRVDLDNDIPFILEKMRDVASSHPDTLSDPEPLATLQNIGEYYLEFKLYFWLADNLIVAPSDITIALHKTLKEAGVKAPVQKTHLKR